MKNIVSSIIISFVMTVLILIMSSCKTNNEAVMLNSDRIASMSIRDKVGMMFMVRSESFAYKRIRTDDINDRYHHGVTKVSRAMADTYRLYPSGGICMFAKNIKSPKQLRRMIADFRRLNPHILFAIDEEGGRITRIACNDKFDVPKFDTMESLCCGKSADEAYLTGQHVGKTIGSYLSDFGFNIDFAPVADVNTNPNNIIIGNRAFGDNPQTVASAVVGVIEGLRDSGIVGCLKHFPGHGDTTADTHAGYVQSVKSWDALLNCEMIPFRAGIEAGAKMVMTAHIALPNVIGDNVPSTLSSVILQDKLRGELGFDGIIITDAISMGAIHNEYTSGEAAVRAISAGCDIILLPYDYVEAFDAVLHAVETGVISEDRINQSISRIAALYQK